MVLNTKNTAAIVSAMDVAAKIRKKVSKENAAMFFFACKERALSLFDGDLVFMNGESRLMMKRALARWL